MQLPVQITAMIAMDHTSTCWLLQGPQPGHSPQMSPKGQGSSQQASQYVSSSAAARPYVPYNPHLTSDGPDTRAAKSGEVSPLLLWLQWHANVLDLFILLCVHWKQHQQWLTSSQIMTETSASTYSTTTIIHLNLCTWTT